MINLKIIEANNNRDRRRYIDFIYKIYKNDPEYSDLNITFVKNFLYKKDSYAKRANIIPIIIEDDELKLVGMYIYTSDSKELKLSFLEFLPNSNKYLQAIVEYGRRLLRNFNLNKIVIGINGHVSYGLGILEGGKNNAFEFNSNYNPNYYIKELDCLNLIKKKAYSYEYNAQNTINILSKIIKNKEEYEYRFFNKKEFKKEMLIFGELTHKSLLNTPYYSEKKPIEMYELMKQMKFILKNEDILFAMKGGKEIGFLFTHPDYAELFDKPKLNYLKLYFRLRKKRPEIVIYNIIGVLPEYQNSGVALNLIYETVKNREKEYKKGVSSFILEENIPSTQLCKMLSVEINKSYNLYEVKRDD